MIDTRNIRLAEIAAGFLSADSRFKSTIFQVFSSSSNIERLGAEFFSKIKRDLIVDVNHPLTFLIGRHSDIDAWFSHEFQYVDKDQKFVFFSKIDKIKLPECSLIIFASPAIHGDNSADSSRAEGVIGIYKALLIALFGRGFLLDQITSFAIEGDGDHKTSFGSNVWRVPQNIDCRAIVDVGAYDELISRVPLQTEPARSQITTACLFFSRAIGESQEYKRFFDYWTALEILGQGKSQKLRAVLGKAYGATLDFVDFKLRFKEISDLRHDLIHSGAFKRLEPEVERRIQGIFLDLMRYKLGLPCKRITERLEG